MSDAPVALALVTDEQAQRIAEFKTALATKYDGVTDRQLLELIAHNSERTAVAIEAVKSSVGPAMEKLSKGGLMGLIKG